MQCNYENNKCMFCREVLRFMRSPSLDLQCGLVGLGFLSVVAFQFPSWYTRGMHVDRPMLVLPAFQFPSWYTQPWQGR